MISKENRKILGKKYPMIKYGLWKNVQRSFSDSYWIQIFFFALFSVFSSVILVKSTVIAIIFMNLLVFVYKSLIFSMITVFQFNLYI